jgi:hypothetical protein
MQQAETLIAARSAALSARESIEAARDAATLAGANTSVTDAWSLAEQLALRADSEYGSGNFNAAAATWAEASKLYEEARQQAEARRSKEESKRRYEQALHKHKWRRLERYGGPYWAKIVELTQANEGEPLDVGTFVARHEEAIGLLPIADIEAERAEKRDLWAKRKAAAPVTTAFLDALEGAFEGGFIGVCFGAIFGAAVGIVAGSLRETSGVREAFESAGWGLLRGASGGAVGGACVGLIGFAMQAARAGAHSLEGEDPSNSGLGIWLMLCASVAGGLYQISALAAAAVLIPGFGLGVAVRLLRRWV